MVSKKENKTESKMEVVIKPKFKQLKDSNRIRLHLMENGNFEGVLIEETTIENFNFRTKQLRGATFRNAIFKDCNFTGCNWTGASVNDCTFINCKMPFGAGFDSIKEGNQFVECRLT